MMKNHALHAAALHNTGQWQKAEDYFIKAEQKQRERLYSTAGFHYCDLLLSQGQPAAARDRAAETLRWTRQQICRHVGLDIALDNMTLGRAHLALALQCLASWPSASADDARVAGTGLGEAIEGLRALGRNDYVPRGLLARAAFRRSIGDWDGVKTDLDEAKEIAESGLMRLYCCDCALEGARLALAQREAFAPLNGLVEPSPPPPVLPDSDEAARLREEARKELDVARKLIAECGYHRRDEELAELDAVIAGGRRFADLPPRV
jgi:tetratricopeptide (TPR) repeat protein